MRYRYQVVEADPNAANFGPTIDEYAEAGWRVNSVVPAYLCRWPRNPDHEGGEDIYVSHVRIIFERTREEWMRI